MERLTLWTIIGLVYLCSCAGRGSAAAAVGDPVIITINDSDDRDELEDATSSRHLGSVVWNSQVFRLEQSSQIVPLLFSSPEFVEDLASAEFTLINASLTLPCSVNVSSTRFAFRSKEMAASGGTEVFILPEDWITFLPAIMDVNVTVLVEGICDLFYYSVIEFEQVPGCQDWSRMEAWQRLRIFYDIGFPIGHTLDPRSWSRQCLTSSGSVVYGRWTVDISRLIRIWLAKRDPWARRNATLPLMILFKQTTLDPSDPNSGIQAQLHFNYWMDSK